jgi:hypothetical protein
MLQNLLADALERSAHTDREGHLHFTDVGIGAVIDDGATPYRAVAQQDRDARESCIRGSLWPASGPRAYRA